VGYLKVKLKGKWEPVCQKEFESYDAFITAKVVCRELGCGHVLESERILKNDWNFSNTIGGIRCSGKEEKTRDCPMNEIELCKKRGFHYIVCSGETD